jgi:hypothetical protein
MIALTYVLTLEDRGGFARAGTWVVIWDYDPGVAWNWPFDRKDMEI